MEEDDILQLLYAYQEFFEIACQIIESEQIPSCAAKVYRNVRDQVIEVLSDIDVD